MFRLALRNLAMTCKGMKFSTLGMLQNAAKPTSFGLFKAMPKRFMGSQDYIKDLKTPEEWENKYVKRNEPIVVEFYAKWCGPCKTLGPVIEKNINAGEGKITLVKVDIDECGDLAREMGVKAIPHVALFHKGKNIDYFVGVSNDEMIIKFFRQARKLAGLKA